MSLRYLGRRLVDFIKVSNTVVNEEDSVPSSKVVYDLNRALTATPIANTSKTADQLYSESEVLKRTTDYGAIDASTHGLIISFKSSANYGRQIALPTINNKILVRNYSNGSFGEWEDVNNYKTLTDKTKKVKMYNKDGFVVWTCGNVAMLTFSINSQTYTPQQVIHTLPEGIRPINGFDTLDRLYKHGFYIGDNGDIIHTDGTTFNGNMRLSATYIVG